MAKDDLIAEARKQFELCVDAFEHNHTTGEEDIRFAREGVQWPDKIAKQREQEGRPCLTINKLPAFIRQVVNDARQNKPSIKVHPADSGADPETAEVINGLIRNIEYTSNADVAYDTATECAVGNGFGYIRVNVEHAYEDSFDTDIMIERVSNPFSIYGDPRSTAADSSDWDVAFETELMSKAEYEAQFGKIETNDWDDDTAWGGAASMSTWRHGEDVLIAKWWSREKVDKQIALFADKRDGSMRVFGKEEIASDPDIDLLLQAGVLEFKAERVTKTCKVTRRIMSGLKILKEEDWPGKFIPIIPVYGDEFDIQGKRYFRSLIHNAIDAQRMFNYWRTTGTELVALAPRVPYLGRKGAFATDIERWNTANTVSHPFLEYDSAEAPQRQPLDSGVAAGALQEALNASDDMKSIIGLYDASLGAKSNETSGRAILARQREGDVSTFHFMDNMARAIRHTGRVIIDLIPKVYSSERIVRVMGEDGTATNKQVNKPYPATDEKTGQPMQQPDGSPVMAIHDLTAGKYDLTVTTGPSFTTRREEAAFQMTEMIRALPESAPILGKHLAKNLDWPGADEIAEELDAMSQGPQVPPEMQQAIEQGKEMIAKQGEEIQSLKSDQSIEAAKLNQQIEGERAKLELQRELGLQKLAMERELALMKIKNDRDIAAMQTEGAEESEGEDGQPVVKSGTEVLMQGITQLGQLIVKQGEAQAAQAETLARIAVAPVVGERLPDGRMAARKVLN
jgi:hypothetical protein